LRGNLKRRIWMTQRRKERNLTQVELAKIVNVSNRTISDIERGYKNPSGRLAMKLSDVLGVDMRKFFEDEEIKAV
jgi:DNA-binding XRE family transcriptional regulator